MLMAGSSVFLGDNLPELNEKGLELVRKTVAAADFTAAEPVLDGNRIPAVWRKENRLYVFNFTEEERFFQLEAQGSWRNLFDEEQFTAQAGKLTVSLPAHGSVCLEKQ